MGLVLVGSNKVEAIIRVYLVRHPIDGNKKHFRETSEVRSATKSKKTALEHNILIHDLCEKFFFSDCLPCKEDQPN